MARIVCLGSALQDIFLIDREDFVAEDIDGHSIFSHLEIGTKVEVDRLSFEVGGGGTNSAVSMARHQHEVVFFGSIAQDVAGEAVLSCLDNEGVDTSYIYYNNRRNTGCSVVLLDVKTGERTILTHRGTSIKFDKLKADDLDNIQPDWLYVTTTHGDMNKLLEFFEKAHEIGCKVMFNPGVGEFKERKKLIGLLEDVDILLVNKKEAAEIVPGKILTELLSRLHNYVETVIITDGAMGGIATDGVEIYRFGLYEDVRVKDTTGAGDAFGSGFLAHLAAGKSFKDSLVFASANSTSVVRHIGAKAGILTGREKLHIMPIQEIK